MNISICAEIDPNGFAGTPEVIFALLLSVISMRIPREIFAEIQTEIILGIYPYIFSYISQFIHGFFKK